MDPLNLLPCPVPRPALSRRSPRLSSRWSTRLGAGLGVAALIGLAVLAGCGGGGAAGGDAGTSGAAAVGGGTATASAAAYTEGTITGFGSVILNGTRFDDSSASVTDDSGTVRALSALKLGMRVEVASSAVASDGTAKASKFSFGSRVVGPVTAVGTSTLTVLGQTIDIVAATVFDSSTLPGGLADITTASVIEVHGLPDSATGHILATRIESASSATSYKLRGTLTGLDTTAKTFNIGGAAISYASATLKPSSLALAENLVVRVVLATTPTSGVWSATTVGSTGRDATTGTAAHVRGTVSALDSTAKTFSVDGLKVDYSGVASVPATLANGVEVDVLGTVSSGVLVATAVTLKEECRGKRDDRFEVHGAITAVDTVAKTFTLRGLTIDTSGTVTYTGGTAAGLVVGAKVEVKGSVGSTRTTVLASAIQFER